MAAVSRKPIYTNKALLSPDELKKAGIEVNEIGLSPMLWPKDYSDYVMLDRPDGCSEPGVSWTPTLFTAKANAFFYSKYGLNGEG